MLIGGYEHEPGRPLDRRRPVGSRREPGRVRHGPLRAAARGSDPALPVPRARRRDPPALPPRRDDARRQPAARPDARRPRLLGRRRALAERLRRRRRDRPGARRVDDRRRARDRRQRLPAPGASARSTTTVVRRRACAREAYRYYYRLRYPFDADEWGRGRALEPAAGPPPGARRGVRRQERLGAAPTTSSPGGAWRRSGADQRGFGWAAPPWFERVGAEHEAFRERVGIIDMTSFGKIEVTGPGALALLERVVRQPHRPAGRERRSTPSSSTRRGGIVADVTVTRLGEQRFRVITGAGDGRRRPRLARAQPPRRATARSRSATAATSSR